MPTDAPPLPAGMDGFAVRHRGVETYAVAIPDARKLAGVSPAKMQTWLTKGLVKTCLHPTHGKLVLVDSLWAAIPDALKR